MPLSLKLVTVPLFSGVDNPEFIKELSALLKPRPMKAGDVIIRQVGLIFSSAIEAARCAKDVIITVIIILPDDDDG